MTKTRTRAETKTKRTRLIPTILAALLCASLQSCFTTGLWASRDLDPAEKMALTPVSLTLDVVTMPVQVAVLRGHRHHHHHCR